MVELGQHLEDTIPPYGYWNMQFYQSESAYVKFEVSIPRGSSIGVYGRRNALPTHTSYDILHVLSGYKTPGPSRSGRASKVIVRKTFHHCFRSVVHPTHTIAAVPLPVRLLLLGKYQSFHLFSHSTFHVSTLLVLALVFPFCSVSSPFVVT